MKGPTFEEKTHILKVLNRYNGSINVSNLATMISPEIRVKMKGKWAALARDLPGWELDPSIFAEAGAIVFRPSSERTVKELQDRIATLKSELSEAKAQPGLSPSVAIDLELALDFYKKSSSGESPRNIPANSHYFLRQDGSGITKVNQEDQVQGVVEDVASSNTDNPRDDVAAQSRDPVIGYWLRNTDNPESEPAGIPSNGAIADTRDEEDLEAFLAILPSDIYNALVGIDIAHASLHNSLIEVVLESGRPPCAWVQDTSSPSGKQRIFLCSENLTRETLDLVCSRLSDFASDNRATLSQEVSTLHRFSRVTDREGLTSGLTMRVGRAVRGAAVIVRDLLQPRGSDALNLLLVGPPGVGKTTLLRDIAREMADDYRNVVVVDSSSEIGGDGLQPHPALGDARRILVSDPKLQADLMQQSVTNHTPDVLIVDEIVNSAEARASQTIGQRGIQLIATAHGRNLADIVDDEQMNKIIGGVHTVILSAKEAQDRGRGERSQREAKHKPVFDIVLEIQSRNEIRVIRDVESAVKAILQDRVPAHERRVRLDSGVIEVFEVPEQSIPGTGH